MQHIIVTIDTEGHKGENPVEKLIWGVTEQGRFGIEKIMDIFDEVGAKILFFLDFGASFEYGEEKIKEVVDVILSRGHDIGVHIHPDHIKDPNRLFLFEYTYKEQQEMITECTKLYEKLVGKKPISFRAGKYGANYDTLDILCKLGYKYDFSEFYHQKWCGINPELTVNAPVRYKSIVEFPVSMFESVHLGPIKREDKIDIEIMRADELKYALGQANRYSFSMAITLFLHSFSLLDWRGHPDTPFPNEENIKKTKEIAKYIASSKDFEFIKEADLYKIPVLDIDEGLKSKVKWKNQIKGLLYTYLRARKVKNKKARLLVWTVRISAILLLALILILLFLFFS